MARRAFKVIDVVEVLMHWHAGRRIGEVSSSMGVDPKTVRKYVAPAVAAGMGPGGPALSGPEWSALVAGWFPELTDRTLRQLSWPEIETHRETIRGWLGTVTVSTIHQRLRDDHGLGVSESSLRRFIGPTSRRRRPGRRWWCSATPPRPVTRPYAESHIGPPMWSPRICGAWAATAVFEPPPLAKNVARDARVAVNVVDPDETSRCFAVRGRVISTTTEGGGREHRRDLAEVLGIPYPNFSGRAETRTLLTIAADSVIPPAG